MKSVHCLSQAQAAHTAFAGVTNIQVQSPHRLTLAYIRVYSNKISAAEGSW